MSMPCRMFCVAPKRFPGLCLDSGDVGTLGDGALGVAFLVGVLKRNGGWKNSLSLVIASFTGVPCWRKGSASLGFFLSPWMRFSIATVK